MCLAKELICIQLLLPFSLILLSWSSGAAVLNALGPSEKEISPGRKHTGYLARCLNPNTKHRAKASLLLDLPNVLVDQRGCRSDLGTCMRDLSLSCQTVH